MSEQPFWYQKEIDDLNALKQSSRLWQGDTARGSWGKELAKDTIREMNMDDERLNKFDRCPHLRVKNYGDEGMGFCGLTERPSGRIQQCVLEGYDKCAIWDEIRLEEKVECQLNNLKSN